jgi:hypothetical protein
MVVRGGALSCLYLVEVPTALCRATQTRNFILLDWEMIICVPRGVSFANRAASWDEPSRTVSNLVAEFYILLGVDDDLLLTIDGDDLGSTVRVARVIDQPPTMGHQKKRTGFNV